MIKVNFFADLCYRKFPIRLENCSEIVKPAACKIDTTEYVSKRTKNKPEYLMLFGWLLEIGTSSKSLHITLLFSKSITSVKFEPLYFSPECPLEINTLDTVEKWQIKYFLCPCNYWTILDVRFKDIMYFPWFLSLK